MEIVLNEFYKRRKERTEKKIELQKVIIEHFVDIYGCVDLCDLDFSGYDVDLSRLKANSINNKEQVAKEQINNSFQICKEVISNNNQKANTYIENSEQICEGTIYNNDQESKEIWQENLKANIVIT